MNFKSGTDQRAPANSPNKVIENKFAELRALIDSSDNNLEIEMLSDTDVQFRNCLMANISEAVVFIDSEKKITSWSRSAEDLTGMSSTNMLGMEFTPRLIGLGSEFSEAGKCPITKCIETQKNVELQTILTGSSGREVSIELRAVPVLQGIACRGCVLLILDRSVNAELKRQLSDLQNASSLDPLTRVANRAEFEKNLFEYVKAHRATDSKCSLIIGDIDFFKMVNDTYGHNVGDQALIAFAQTLKQFVRSRDVVARYGGEEFVILCANCDLESAVERAEQIRMSLNRAPQAMLDGKTMSASFGVAELNDTEDVTDFFVRADEALYAAKQNGRNRVERAARSQDTRSAASDVNFEVSSASGVKWRKLSKGCMVSEEFRTSTPSNMLAEKLRGFINESETKIRKIEPNYASLEIVAVDPHKESKRSNFRVDVELYEDSQSSSNQLETYIRITIFPPRQRMFGRVHKDLHAYIMTDLRRYLMITDDTAIVRLNPAATSSGRDEN